MNRLLFGPRRRTPLELVAIGAATVLAGITTGVACGVEPELVAMSGGCDIPIVAVVDFAGASVAACFGGNDGGGTGITPETLDAEPLLFRSLRFPFPDTGLSVGPLSALVGGAYGG